MAIWGDLIQKLLKIMNTFNEMTHSVDTHIQVFFEQNKISNQNEMEFLQTIFYGLHRYKEFIESFNSGFSKVSYQKRNDLKLLNIFTFIIFFKLESINTNEFKQLADSQNQFKLNELFKFLFSKQNLIDYCRPLWSQSYDLHFIDNEIINQIEKKQERLKKVIDFIENKVTGNPPVIQENTQEVQIKEKQVTQIQEFNLTKVKPKNIPEPLQIDCKVYQKPIPKSCYNNDLSKIDEEKKNRYLTEFEKTKEKYEKQAPLVLKVLERPSNLEQVKQVIEILIQKVQEQFEKDVQFNKFKAAQMPDFDQKKGNVKMNMNQILREQTLMDKENKKRDQLMLDQEVGIKGLDEYNDWIFQNKEEEKNKKIQQTHKLKIQMELCRDAAIHAVKDKHIANNEKARELKIENKQKLEEMEENHQKEIMKKQKLIEFVHEVADKAQQEQQKLERKKRKIRDDVVDELGKMNQHKKEEDARQFQKRKELIKQIRSIVNQPRERSRSFDPKTNMGFGLLEEMSLHELKQKLKEIKIQQKQDVIDKNNELNSQRDNQLQNLNNKLEQLQHYKTQQQSERERSQYEKQKKKNDEYLNMLKIKEKNLLEAFENIQNKKDKKRQEDIILQKQLKEIRLKQQYAQADQGAMERKMNQTLMNGQERELFQKQGDKILLQFYNDQSKLFDIETNAKYQLQLKKQQQAFFIQQSKNLEKDRQENDLLRLNEELKKKTQVSKIKTFEESLTVSKYERNRYVQKINDISLENSKKYQSKKSLHK